MKTYEVEFNIEDSNGEIHKRAGGTISMAAPDVDALRRMAREAAEHEGLPSPRSMNMSTDDKLVVYFSNNPSRVLSDTEQENFRPAYKPPPGAKRRNPPPPQRPRREGGAWIGPDGKRILGR